MSIESVYDRSDLIYRAIETLKRTLIEESAIVALVCVVFLLHVRSALVATITLHLYLSAGDPCGASVQGRHDPGRLGDPGRQSLALAQKFQPLCRQLTREKIDPC